MKRWRYWTYFGWPSVKHWFFTGGKAGWRCEKCNRWRWAEELVLNFGWCNRCFNTSYDQYLRTQGVQIHERL